MTLIQDITAREILDATGVPTLEAEIVLNCGALGRASVPAGVSGELRDNDPLRFRSQGVGNALEQVRDRLSLVIRNMDSLDQNGIDHELDTLLNLSGNAKLVTSLAVAQAAAIALEIPLYRYLGGINAKHLPMPLVSVMPTINSTKLPFRDFLLMPVKAGWRFRDALRATAEITGELAQNDTPYTTATEWADIVRNACEKCRYDVGNDILFAVAGMQTGMDFTAFLNEMQQLAADAPIKMLSIDPQTLNGEQLEALAALPLELAVEQPFDTNAPSSQAIHCQILALNYYQTLTAFMDNQLAAREHARSVIIAADSRETDDTFTADLAIACHAAFFRAGSLMHGDAVAKYNHLLRLEESLLR